MTRRIVVPLILGCAVLCGGTGCAPLVIGGAATGVAVAHDRRTAGTVLDDQTIEIKAAAALDNDKALYSQTHLNVTSYDYVLLLTGEAPTQELKDRAENLVKGIEKVRKVVNDIQIAAPSSFMTRSSDTVITGKVKAAFFDVKLKDFDPTRVKVVTENGTVYLLGLVTHAEGDAATNAARTVGGVQRVVKLFEYID